MRPRPYLRRGEEQKPHQPVKKEELEKKNGAHASTDGNEYQRYPNERKTGKTTQSVFVLGKEEGGKKT